MSLELSRRVDWPMIDPAQVVYYPVYWDLAHRFFEESWEKICGISYPVIINEHRLGFPAVSTSSTHHSPLRYGDTVCCILSVSKVGKSSTVWNYSSKADTHTVETHIYRLRKKIKSKFLDESFILNNKSGYYL